MEYPVLTDRELRRVLTMKDAVRSIEGAVREKAAGTLNAPPRFHVDSGKGSLVFTAGASGQRQVIGFRVYGAFPGGANDQVVVVFDGESGALKGIAIGEVIGVMRTGAIGGVGIQHMSRPDSKILGVIGSGRQARSQVQAAAAVRSFERARVFSPNPQHCETFARELSDELGLKIEVGSSARAVVEDADVLICATKSTTPVFEASWLKPGAHVNTVGAKFKDAHELEPAVAAQSRVIATDSLAQVDAYPEPFFLAGTPEKDRLVELSDVVAGKIPGRLSPQDITLFCSVGLAGTEVVLAAETFRIARERAMVADAPEA